MHTDSAGSQPSGAGTQNSRLARFALWCMAHRALTVLLALIIVGLFAGFATRLKFDNTPDSFFLADDPTLQIYQRFKDQFETDEYSLILLRSPAQWDDAFVGQLRQLTQELAALEHVERVTAITNVRHIESSDLGLAVGDFLPAGLNAETLAQRRELARTHPYYRNLYLSADGDYLGVVVETAIIAGEVAYKIELAGKIRELIEQSPYRELQAKTVGAPILDAEVRTIVDQESGLFGGIAFLLVGVGFALVFRSWRGFVLPLVVAVGGILVAFGSMGLMGAPITLLTPIVPSFLISVGVGSSIFLITQFYNARQQGLTPQLAVVSSLQHAGLACVVASLTTALALIGFSTSRIAPVMQVGLAMGLGLLGALVLTLLLFPLMFGSRRTLPPPPSQQQRYAGRLRLLQGLSGFVLGRPRQILGVFALVLVLAGLAAWQLRADYYYLGIFKEPTRIRQDYAAIDAVLPTSAAVEVLLEMPQVDAFKQPEALHYLDQLAQRIRQQAEIPVAVYSLADVVKEINQALLDGDATEYRLPHQYAAISQQLLLFESSGHDELTRLTNHDYNIARMTVRVPNLPDSAYQPLVQMIQTEARGLQEEAGAALAPLQISVTGLVPMWMKISSYLSASQLQSILAAFIVVTLVMILSFRSFLLGLLMSLLNASVVLIILGLMGALGVALDPYTILISAIALGILDDDTIHFVRNILDERRAGADMATAVQAAYRDAGQAMFYSSAVLVLSFSAYALSAVASLSKFGIIVAVTLVLGLLLEFLITPSLMLLLDRWGWLGSQSAPATPAVAVT